MNKQRSIICTTSKKSMVKPYKSSQAIMENGQIVGNTCIPLVQTPSVFLFYRVRIA